MKAKKAKRQVKPVDDDGDQFYWMPSSSSSAGARRKRKKKAPKSSARSSRAGRAGKTWTFVFEPIACRSCSVSASWFTADTCSCVSLGRSWNYSRFASSRWPSDPDVDSQLPVGALDPLGDDFRIIFSLQCLRGSTVDTAHTSVYRACLVRSLGVAGEVQEIGSVSVFCSVLGPTVDACTFVGLRALQKFH